MSQNKSKTNNSKKVVAKKKVTNTKNTLKEANPIQEVTPKETQSNKVISTPISTKDNPKKKLKTTVRPKNNKNLIKKVFDKFVGEGKELNKYWKIADQIELLEPEIKKLSDKQLRAKTTELRNRLVDATDKNIEKKLTAILPEAFAVVREAALRTIGQRHFPVQLIGGMVLHDGRVAEMRTGEGKTLVSTLNGYLNALRPESQVHIVTVNDYLARRDASWMGKIYDFLGLTVGVIQNQASFYFKLGAQSSDSDNKKRTLGIVDTYEDGQLDDKRAVLDVENLVHCDRKRAYWIEEENKPIDIVYGVNSEFGFDYLRDNMAKTPKEITQRAGHHVAIVDEVDSILIDEARTPLIISNADQDSSARYKQFSELVKKLNPEKDYKVDEKRKTAILTEEGMVKINKLLGVEDLYATAENVVLVHHLDLALKAISLFAKEKDYVIRNGEIIIVDQNTGRLMFGRRYNQGLHQAIEAKENLEVKSESKTVASITFQNYFRLYKKLSGMTGTAATESEELYKIYKLFVVTIPTNKNVQRKDKTDKIFKAELGKFTAIVRDIKEIHSTGQPILIGTTSIDKNILLGEILTKAGIPFQLLNAKNHEQEAHIISQAGKKGTVTLATNIAGRGVDIKLGGEIPENPDLIEQWKKDHEEIKSLGGLFVIGTERHESRRIDNQLRGRAGRQGDPGVSQFYVSLQDYVLRVFGGDRVSYYYDILPMADDEAIEQSFLSKLIEQAQKKIEGFHYDMRKNITDYDDVINKQRTVIYALRKSVLMNEDKFEWKAETKKALYNKVFSSLKMIKLVKKNKNKTLINVTEASKELKDILPLSDFDTDVLKVFVQDNKLKFEVIAKILTEKLISKLEERWEIYQEKVQAGLARYVFLRAIDILWTEHLVTIDHLNDSVKLRSYAQKDPLVQFKEDGMSLFLVLLEEIDSEFAKTIFKVNPDLVPAEIIQD